MKHLFTLKKYFYRHRFLLALGMAFTITANFFKVYSIPLIEQVINNIKTALANRPNNQESLFKSEVYEILTTFLIFYLGFSILSGLLTFMMRQTIIVVSRKIEYDLKKEIFAQYQRLDLAFFKQNKTGDLMSRITEDVSRVREFAGPALMYSVNLISMIFICTHLMYSQHKMLTVIALIPLPILSIVIYLIEDYINKNAKILQEKLSKLTSIAQEVYSGIRVVKGFVQEKTFYKIFDDEANAYKAQAIKIARIDSFYSIIWTGIISLSTIVTVYYSNKFLIKDEINAAQIISFVMYVNLLSFPITALGWVATMTQRGDASMQRINEFLQIKSTLQNSGAAISIPSGRIQFEGVSFTYPETGIKALDKVSFDIPAGQSWAIVGKTGCGKSTLAELMMRLYDPNEGKILIDGQAIAQFEIGQYRQQIGYVPQDVFLFSDTVANNIGFGAKEYNLNAIKNAAEKASISHEIEGFPNQYETVVGERGVTLSGGQKQRISIARAFMIEPKILILDDCLSAVDVTTEQRIVQNLKDVFENKTTITITHRIFSNFQFDNILVMKDGAIAEQGSHEALLDLNGIYSELYALQENKTNADV